MSNQPKSIDEIAAELQDYLNGKLDEVITAPLSGVVEQIQLIAGQEHRSPEQKSEDMEKLQMAIILPLENALVQVALASGMSLGSILLYFGLTYEAVRQQSMTQMAERMLNPNKGAENG